MAHQTTSGPDVHRYPSPEQQGGYPPPQQGGYPPQQGGYPPQQGGYPPQQGGYVSPGASGYVSPGASGYPPPGGYPPPPPAGYPPQGPPGPPQGIQWMQPPPQPPPDCPPGLEYLALLDQLFIKQKIELLEAFTGFETENKYAVENGFGQNVYFAAEESSCLARNCIGKQRPFSIRIIDNFNREVMHFTSPYRCEACCFPCFLKEITTEAPTGTVVGKVKQLWACCVPKFSVQDAAEQEQLYIEGPCIQCAACGDVRFQIYGSDRTTPIGMISKKWSGLLQEAFTDADNFGVTFPVDLSVKTKATLLSAVFMIDFMFFEEEGNKKNKNIGMMDV